MSWLMANLPTVLGIGVGVVSEVLSVMQALKYPLNSGAGGVLVGIYKALKGFGAADLPPPAV